MAAATPGRVSPLLPRTGPSGRRGRVRTVCTECRKAKVRCNFDQIPCSRCQRLQLRCHLDRSSQQRSVVSQVSQLERKVRSHREQLGDGSESPLNPPDTDGENRETREQQPLPRGSHNESCENDINQSPPAVVINPRPLSPLTPFVLGTLSLTQELASQLFAIFFTKYHPHIPFLDPNRSPLSYRESSELLFWAIISVAARDQQNAVHFLDDLTPFFSAAVGRLLVGSSKGDSIHLGDVQALALLSLWPWQNVHWWTDRSWNLGNLAFSSAIQIGLHQPYFETEYSLACGPISDNIRSERVRTFCACIAVAHNLTVDVGLSSTLPFGNWIVGTACDGTSLFHIPPDLRHYLIIQEASYASFTSLPTPMTPHSLVLYSRSLATALPRSEQRLNDLMQTNMSLFNKMNLAAAQLYLQSMYFHLDDSESCRNAGILRTYTTALRLVDMAMSSTESSNILQYSPRTTVRMLNIAAAVIFRVLHSSLRGEVSYDAGRSLFNAAALCMSQQAVKSRAHDTPARWATFLHKMWEYGGKNEMLLLSPPMLQIKSRGGASILYDCLKMFRQKSQTSHNPQVRDVAVSELNLPINDQAMEPTLDSRDPDLFDFLWTDELCDSYLYDVS